MLRRAGYPKLNPSTVLTAAELKGITDQYVGKAVSTKELYAMVEQINKLYTQKGYLTCRALLMQQTVKDGVVRLELVEVRTGTVEVRVIKQLERTIFVTGSI